MIHESATLRSAAPSPWRDDVQDSTAVPVRRCTRDGVRASATRNGSEALEGFPEWRRHPMRIVAVAALFAVAACQADSPPPQEARTVAGGIDSAGASSRAVADSAGDDGEWRMPAKDYASRRYSGLTEITTENVASLKLAWTFSTGIDRGQEAAPLVVGSTMYVVTPYP